MTDAATRTLLRKALALIEDPRCWTQGSYARNKYGHIVNATSRSAVKFCAIGAIDASFASVDIVAEAAAHRFLEKIFDELYDHRITEVNDAKPRREAHARVLAAYRHAIGD